MRSSALSLVVLACCLSVGVASASSISFTGTFITDDQLEVFQFTALTPSFTAQTLSYAGGTNANGTVIPAGGFDPFLSLFDATGGLVTTNDDNPAATVDPSTTFAFDSLLTVGTLTPGDTYRLVLSENDNVPVDSSYADGFTQTGNPTFTATEFGCPGGGPGPFCDEGMNQRNGKWAVDLIGVSSASDISGGAAPEPGSILLLSAGLASLALLRRRRKQKQV